MKVLQINSVCGLGSTGRIATDIHKILIEHGHKSYIAYGRDYPVNCDSSIRIGTNYDNYTHALITRIFDKHGFGSKNATKNFISSVKKIDPDIIHLHNIHGYYVNIGILFEYLKKANKPVIWTLHDCWAFTGHCAYFDYVGCEKWKTGCFKCPQKNTYPSSLLVDNSRKNHIFKKELFTGVKDLTIITPSEWLTGKVEESFLKEYPIRVLKNGIDLNIFSPRKSNYKDKYNIKNKKIVLGVANTWEDRKGYGTFLELANMIDQNTVIIMIGLNRKQIKSLPSNIIGIERTSNIEELVELYSIADVCANPSVEETFGLVTVEAMACGTPVVVYDATASPELVDDTVGAVIEKGNLIEFSKAINNILKQGKNVFSDACRNKVINSYDKGIIHKQMIELYKSKI